MHAYIIVGNNQDALEKEIVHLIKSIGSKPLEFSVDKIEKVRELGKFLSFSQSEKTTIVIKNIDSGTTEALNAFLKNLEEPQENITFILTASSEYKVLPTILSRSQIIKIGNRKIKDGNKYLEKFTNASIGERLQMIDKIKKREEAVEFIEQLIYESHQNLEKEKKVENFHDLGEFLKISQDTLNALNANGNLTIQLTNFLLKVKNNTGSDTKNIV